jgi:hypothetical protein
MRLGQGQPDLLRRPPGPDGGEGPPGYDEVPRSVVETEDSVQP